MTSEGLNHVSMFCGELESLNLSGCTRLSGQSLVMAVLHNQIWPTTLQHLKIDSLQALNDNHFKILVNLLKRLIHLDVGHTAITDAGLKFMFESEVAHNLQYLGVSGCSGISVPMLRKVGSCCPSLRGLDLSELCQLSDSALCSILADCGHLENINIAACTSLCSSKTTAALRSCATLHAVSVSRYQALFSFLKSEKRIRVLILD